MKRIVLVFALASSFLVGYSAIAKAWPGVPDRNAYHGYFSNTYDTSGDSVIQNGYPGWVNNANAFISFIEDRLRNGPPRDRVGAAFTIQTMRGNASGWSRNNPPAQFEIDEWEARVRYAESQGWINWGANFTYSGNSFWQGNMGGGPNPNDDAFYYEAGTRFSIIFRDSSGGAAYVIKRDCGNPLTNGYMPGLDNPGWTASGHTDALSATAQPGDTIKFNHYVKNEGPLPATIYWGTYDSNTNVRTGGWVLDAYAPGEQKFVNTETVVVPNNAFSGQKICRQVAYFWHASWDPTEDKGAPACTTIFIPAKLKAAMSVAPPTMAAGETATFTPTISETSNTSSIIVNCSIVRTLVPPSGPTTSLGNQPCVDSAGNSNIVIGSGAAVNLRPNSYAAPDNIPVGSKVCDTITITNPSSPSNYNSYPADQTAQSCVTIAKSPYVQFIGDVWAGGGFAAVAPGTCNNAAKITTITRSTPLADGSRPGSGTTYAAFALGKITNFGSGSMAYVTSTGVGKAMTFSNINSSNLGVFGASPHCITDYATTYQTAPPLGAGTYDVGSGGSGQWHITGNTTFHGTMAAGVKKVYFVTGNVTIDADLKYPATFANAANIPSIVIIATGNILVSPGVQQLDGMYISRGTFYTCWPKVEPATIGTCSNRLTVNGSVAATALDLFRTAGADGSTPALQKLPAEAFNLSPEVFLTNALNQSSQTVITTNNIRELAPRF